MKKKCENCSSYNDGLLLIHCENCSFYSLWRQKENPELLKREEVRENEKC